MENTLDKEFMDAHDTHQWNEKTSLKQVFIEAYNLGKEKGYDEGFYSGTDLEADAALEAIDKYKDAVKNTKKIIEDIIWNCENDLCRGACSMAEEALKHLTVETYHG